MSNEFLSEIEGSYICNDVEIRENERVDDLQRNGLKIIQNSQKFCFGIDAVLLSDFAKVKSGEKVLDIGTGTGIIPILLTAKSKGSIFYGLEIQEESAEMAERSVKMNNLCEKVKIIHGDIKNAKDLLEYGSFDVVTCNPPYMIERHGIINEDEPKTIARHEVKCTFEDIVSKTSKLLKANGRFFIIHRPFRLVELFSTLTKYGLEPKRMRMVHPYIDKEPNMVLIEALKNGKPRLITESPLIVYEKNGEYTEEIYRIYGDV